MIERTTYICEYCGEVFDSEEDCAQHETKEKKSFLAKRLNFLILIKKKFLYLTLLRSLKPFMLSTFLQQKYVVCLQKSFIFIARNLASMFGVIFRMNGLTLSQLLKKCKNI